MSRGGKEDEVLFDPLLATAAWTGVFSELQGLGWVSRRARGCGWQTRPGGRLRLCEGFG